jgi:dolichol kinase
MPAFGSFSGEMLRASLLGVIYALIFGLADLVYRRWRRPEWSRKFIHFWTGLTALAFPWLFAQVGTVLAMGGILALYLWMARRRGFLPSLFQVGRSSRGELYFLLAVAILFLLARDEPVFYVVSILTLVLCDSVAAILGEGYGRHRFQVAEAHKSLEGSFAFLVSVFLVVHLPLLLWSDVDRANSVLVATQLALLVTSVEAISGRGTDNLLVPLGTYYLLLKMTPHSAATIGLQLCVQLAILIVVVLIALRTRFFSVSGAIAAQLVLYAAYSLGGPRWVWAPALSLFVVFAVDALNARQLPPAEGRYPVRAVFHVSIVAVLAIFADNTFATLVDGGAELSLGHPFHTLFAGALAAATSLASLRSFEVMLRRRPRWQRRIVALVVGYLLIAPAAILFEREALPGRELAVTAFVCLASLSIYAIVQGQRRPQRDVGYELSLVSFSVLIGSLAILPLHLYWLGALR